MVKFEQLPHFLEIFSSSDPPSCAATSAGPSSAGPTALQPPSASNGAASGSDSDSSKSDLLNNNNSQKDGDAKPVPGDIRMSGRTYSVTDSAHLFLSILVSPNAPIFFLFCSCAQNKSGKIAVNKGRNLLAADNIPYPNYRNYCLIDEES